MVGINIILTIIIFSIIYLNSGPQILNNGTQKWNEALEKGIIPQDILEKYNKGGYIEYTSPYGKAYISKKSFEIDKKIVLDLEKTTTLVSNFFEYLYYSNSIEYRSYSPWYNWGIIPFSNASFHCWVPLFRIYGPEIRLDFEKNFK